MENDIKEVYFSAEEIDKIVKKLGKQISEDYKDKNLLLVSILKGSVIFMADLMRSIDIPCRIDFMSVSSYGNGSVSSGKIIMKKDLEESIVGKNVIVVEDIVDTGRTLSYLMDNLKQRGPKSLKLCAMLDKPDRRVVDIKADYTGFEIPDLFVIGYGLDYAQRYRNLPYIGVLEVEE